MAWQTVGLEGLVKASSAGMLWISAGRAFQRVGAAILKALSPKDRRLVRGARV